MCQKISVAGHRHTAEMACADVDVFAVSVQDEIVIPIDNHQDNTLLAKNEDCSKSDVQWSIPVHIT